MASGGFHPNKQAKSETKRRSNWQRSVSSDRDDAQSLNSLPSDIRINNWDMSDLRPTNLSGDSKRRKKSKGNPEREREQSLSMDSPPHGDQKHHTPSTFPRTKITPSTPTSQKMALENLKQHMTFSDLDDQVSTDGERNNERPVSQSRGRRFHNTSFNRTDSDTRGSRERRVNQNINTEPSSSRMPGPDSNEIVARLMQIRDFMKQAKAMMESMERLGDRKKAEDIEKVRRLIRNLQEQEQGYQGLLQSSVAPHEGDGEEIPNGHGNTSIKVEVKDGSDDSSVDLEVHTQNSGTTENSQDSRPRIESKLGLDSDVEEEDQADAGRTGSGIGMDNANSNRTMEMGNSIVPAQFTLPGVPIQESDEGARAASAIDGEGTSLQNQELLQILREKQQQLQALMDRQEELNLKRRETEKKLLHAQARDNKARAALTAVTTGKQFLQQRLIDHQTHNLEAAIEWAGLNQGNENGKDEDDDDDDDGDEDEDNEEEDDDVVEIDLIAGAVGGEGGVLKSNIVGYPESDDEDNSNVREADVLGLPNELLELKRQLNFLRNEFSQVDEAPKNVESETQALVEDRQQLQNKLQELQDKKSRMDKLLQELQMLHAQPLAGLRNNEPNQPGSVPSPAATGGPAVNIPSSSQPKQRQQHQQQQQHKQPPPPPPPPQPALPNLRASSDFPANLRMRMNDVASKAPRAVESAMAMFSQLARDGGSQDSGNNMDVQMVAEVQEKLRRLQQVRGQLDQLQGLVQYYQAQKDDGDTAEGDDQSSLPGFSDSGDRSGQNAHVSTDISGSRSSLQVQPHPLQRHQQIQQQLPQHRRGREETSNSAAAATASSLQNMAHLLNLAGADQGDEHSDEDNASASMSESQWSHLGPWDDDPEIQEKVKKLKAAKEKLRQLQDLVAFVQQSPDAGRALPETLGEMSAASVEGEAVSHATQTDEPNASVSEGEVPMDNQQCTEDMENMGDDLEERRAELGRLRKERARLLELQSRLKDIHNVVGRATPEDEGRGEDNTDMGKPGLEQAPGATVVTFASNDELYSKMRRQRILTEELRSKKKELEAIMKKDRNKRQYSRNQDNQSDTVSLNTDTFGISASVDATMATWGGSTVDNLENITEDEGGQERNGRVDGDEEDDDGYPSDGIVQVEEEEEENDSDNGTYTIEANARQRKNMRSSAGMGVGARPKTSRGRQTFPKPSYGDQTMKKAPRKRSTQRPQRNSRDSKMNLNQENYQSDEDVLQDQKVKNSQWFRLIEGRLNSLSGSVETLIRKSDSENRQLSVSLSQENAPQGSGVTNPIQEQMLQLHNQSMMLNFGQVVQSLSRQQVDMQQMQQQIQMLQLQVQEYQNEHSFHNMTAGGVGMSSNMLRPALSTTALNNSSNNLPSVSLNSLGQQTSLNNTVPVNSLFVPGQGLRSGPQHPSLAHSASAHNMSLGVPGGGGAGLSVGTGSTMSLPQQVTPAGLGFSPLGQSTMVSSSQAGLPQLSQDSCSTMTRDFSQFVNTLQPHTSSQVESFPQFSTSLFGASSQQQQQQQQAALSVSSRSCDEGYDKLEEESPLSRMNPYMDVGHSRNPPRNYGNRIKKSESEPTSGLRLPKPKVENSQQVKNRDSGMTSSSRRRSAQRGASTSGHRLRGNHASSFSAQSAGGEADGNTFDASSSVSSIQSIREQHARLREGEHTQPKSSASAEDGNTLFDTLRDTIYTEVASLISQNENRPHFLLELFRDMRLIDSDYMRQRTIYSIQELLSSNLKSESAVSSNTPAWMKIDSNIADMANSEQTPSESVTSEDEEEFQVMRQKKQLSTASERSRIDRLARDGPLQNFAFDYVEHADNPSSQSTPTNGCEEEAPFFRDIFGETVIEFESLKQAEDKKHKGGRKERTKRPSSQAEDRKLAQPMWGQGAFLASEQLLRDITMRGSSSSTRAREGASGVGGATRSTEVQTLEGASNSTVDEASESSFSDVPYPRIDMKELDRQIKDIMMETIPVVKEHMEDVCSPQLLAYIMRLILSLTSQLGNQEFARFFQRQLASILQDTLNKYEGRKMRECGEDLLVEISDVLFNELAFFRLMQDLDDPGVAGKIRASEWTNQVSEDKNGSSAYSAGSSSSEEEDDDENDQGDVDDDSNEGKSIKDGDDVEIRLEKAQRGFRVTEAEQDVMGRDRDDEMANEICIHDEKEDEDTEQSYKIELAPSETKPFTRIGSDEDDEDGDEEQSMEDPSETAVSRDAMLETNGQQGFTPASLSIRPETEGAQLNGAEKQDPEKPFSPRKPGLTCVAKQGGDAETSLTTGMDSVQVNGSVNGEEDDNDLTINDLPERLNVPSSLSAGVAISSSVTTATTPTTSTTTATANTPGLRRRLEDEQRSMQGLSAVLASLATDQELAGDPLALADPDTFSS